MHVPAAQCATLKNSGFAPRTIHNWINYSGSSIDCVCCGRCGCFAVCACVCGVCVLAERLLRAVSCVSCCVCNVWHFSPRLGVPSACVVCAFCLDLSLPPASSSHTTFCLAWCVPSACARVGFCLRLHLPPATSSHTVLAALKMALFCARTRHLNWILGGWFVDRFGLAHPWVPF